MLVFISVYQVFIAMATAVSVLLSTWFSVCVAMNLDTLFPLLKKGEKESLFGLSVALHHHLKTGTYLLLVGAPREWAEHNVPANRTGGLYSCSITVDQSDCSRIKLVDPDLNPSEDLVEDMWLGVSVASQGYPGGRVLVSLLALVTSRMGGVWMVVVCYPFFDLGAACCF
uniref:Uncharacterized protein n=1 Tax=Takifugu rubripes TaxID=31033 RepID=A0A674M9K1_TAKRU